MDRPARAPPPQFSPTEDRCEYISYGLLLSLHDVLTDTRDRPQYDGALRALCDGKPSPFQGCTHSTVRSLAALVSYCCVWQDSQAETDRGTGRGFFSTVTGLDHLDTESVPHCIAYCNANWWYCMCASRLLIRHFHPLFARAILAAFYLSFETAIPLKLYPGIHQVALPLWEAAKCAYRRTRREGGEPGPDASSFSSLHSWYLNAFALNPGLYLAKCQAPCVFLPPYAAVLGSRRGGQRVMQRAMFSRTVTRAQTVYELEPGEVYPGAPFAARMRASVLFLSALVIQIARSIYYRAGGKPRPGAAPGRPPKAGRPEPEEPWGLTSRDVARTAEAWVLRMARETRAEAARGGEQALRTLHLRAGALGRLVEALDLHRRLQLLVVRMCPDLGAAPGGYNSDSQLIRYAPSQLRVLAFENCVELMYVDLLGYRWKRACRVAGRSLGAGGWGLSLCGLALLLAERHWSNPLFMARLLAAVAAVPSPSDPVIPLRCELGWRKLFYAEGAAGPEGQRFAQVTAGRMDASGTCRPFDDDVRFCCMNPCGRALARLLLYYLYEETCELVAGFERRDFAAPRGAPGYTNRDVAEALLPLVRRALVLYVRGGWAGGAEGAPAAFSADAWNAHFYRTVRVELESAARASQGRFAAGAAGTEFDGSSVRIYRVVDFLNHHLCTHPLPLSPSNYLATMASVPPAPVPTWRYTLPIGPWGVGETRSEGPSPQTREKYRQVVGGLAKITPADFPQQQGPPRHVLRARETAFAQTCRVGLGQVYPRPALPSSAEEVFAPDPWSSGVASSLAPDGGEVYRFAWGRGSLSRAERRAVVGELMEPDDDFGTGPEPRQTHQEFWLHTRGEDGAYLRFPARLLGCRHHRCVEYAVLTARLIGACPCCDRGFDPSSNEFYVDLYTLAVIQLLRSGALVVAEDAAGSREASASEAPGASKTADSQGESRSSGPSASEAILCDPDTFLPLTLRPGTCKWEGDGGMSLDVVGSIERDRPPPAGRPASWTLDPPITAEDWAPGHAGEPPAKRNAQGDGEGRGPGADLGPREEYIGQSQGRGAGQAGESEVGTQRPDPGVVELGLPPPQGPLPADEPAGAVSGGPSAGGAGRDPLCGVVKHHAPTSPDEQPAGDADGPARDFAALARAERRMRAIARTIIEKDPMLIYWGRHSTASLLLAPQLEGADPGPGKGRRPPIVFPYVHGISPKRFKDSAEPYVFLQPDYAATPKVDPELLHSSKDQAAVLEMLREDGLGESDEELDNWVDS